METLIMATDHPDYIIEQPTEIPDFTSDFVRASMTMIIAIIVWVAFFTFVYPFLYYSFPIIGLFAAAVIIMFLLSYTFSIFSNFLGVLAYQLVSMQTGLQYMNYSTKCPYLQRKWLSFTCRAEQLSEFDVPAYRKCHKESMWLECWPERISSILQVYDSVPPKQQQGLAYILANMKELGRPASDKMVEVLKNETNDVQVRLAAGYALSQMKE
jgi:hypothetical protein